MTTPYITIARVKEAMRSTYDGSDDAVLADLVVANSAWLDTYTNRANGGFATQVYDELYSGTGDSLMFLNQTPIQSISRIATAKQPVVSIHNTDADMGCRATVQVVGTATNPDNLNTQYPSTGLVLTYVKGGVTTTNTLTWAAYPTITQLVAAINAAGNNWTAIVQGGFGSWSSTDIRASQGAYGARITTAYLWIHWMDLPEFSVVNANSGEIHTSMGFCRGVANYRINYTAGYAAFPDDLTQALAEMVVNCYYAREANSNMQSESLGPVSYTQFSDKGFDGLSIMSKKTIGRYKIRKVGKFSTW